MRQDAGTPDWATVAEVQEFVPQGFDGAHVVSPEAPSVFRTLPILPLDCTPRSPSPPTSVIMSKLGSLHHHSSRSLSALADDFDPVVERGRNKHRSSSVSFEPTDSFFQAPLQGNGNGAIAASSAFDPFVTASAPLAAAGAVGPVSANPYSHDPAAAALGGAFFANQTGFQQPVCHVPHPWRANAISHTAQVQYHLYAPIGPHNQNTLGYQRNVHDLFLPNDFREELQKKAAATLQTLPSLLTHPFTDWAV